MSLFGLEIETTTIIAYINIVKSRDAYDNHERNSNVHLTRSSNLLHRVENSTVQWISHNDSHGVSCSNVKTN